MHMAHSVLDISIPLKPSEGFQQFALHETLTQLLIAHAQTTSTYKHKCAITIYLRLERQKQGLTTTQPYAIPYNNALAPKGYSLLRMFGCQSSIYIHILISLMLDGKN